MESLLGSSSWLYIIFIGLIVGVLARFLKPGRDGMGFFMTILLGIAGAAGASWVGQYMDWYAPDQAAGFWGALLGAIVILLIASLFRGKKRSGLPPR